MNDSNSFIKEYFELTGRPISTMTVEEYVCFKKATNNVPTVLVNESEHPEILISQPVIEESANENNHEREYPKENRKITAIEAVKNEEKNKPQISSKEDMLARLRSISG